MMTFDDFLTEVIRRGIDAVKVDYAHKEQHRLGAIAGFEACRGKTPAELALLLQDVNDRVKLAFRRQEPNYWYYRCQALEVQWCCNVASAVLLNEGRPTIIPPTVRAMQLAADIVGVEY